MNLTIYIPTFNRSKFLKRALDYYSLMKFDGKILIADSSSKNEKELNRKFIREHSDLDIEYHWFDPNKIYHDAMKTYLILNHIKTDYISFSGDDDFQIKSGCLECIDFLDKNKDYISAHGKRLNFLLDGVVYGNIVNIDIIDGYNWNIYNPVKQWQEYLRIGIATTYYVHRTSAWKKYYKYSYKAKSNYIGNELIPCSMCSLLGKVKRLDNCFSTAFQMNNPIRVFSFVKTTLWDLIHKEYWKTSVEYFKEAVVSVLSEKMNKSEAEELFYKEFWYHCLLVMNSQFNRKYSSKQEEQTRKPLDLNFLTEHDEIYWINKVLKNDRLSNH